MLGSGMLVEMVGVAESTSVLRRKLVNRDVDGIDRGVIPENDRDIPALVPKLT